MSGAWILGAVRTPGCKAKKGKLKDVRPDDLAAIAIRALLERTGVEPGRVEDVIMGCAFPEGEQGMNLGRVAAMRAGLPVEVPGQTVNRFCASGLQAIATAAERILAGHADVIVAGGAESMSLVPMGGARFSANPGLVASWPESYAAMGITAELVASRYRVSREDQDAFAAQSHARAAAAQAQRLFAGELVPVDVERVALVDGKLARGRERVEADDGVRADTTPEALARLAPAFKANGSVTAGNASQMTDGAAAVLVVSEAFLARTEVAPLGRFVSYAVRGVPPEVMGIGPVEAIPLALARAGILEEQLGQVELNEAFAAQAITCVRALGLDPARVNPTGGAIALGHPLGCTGAKLTATLLHGLRRTGERYGAVSMCVGGGMGAAAVFERA
ncbi:acetyl-CoA C-acyltransferase [Anaeromyxobacter sp. Fw109-5]|uniref:acetyl-CoA C-acyltransferase n=1 Tax=Anaeromyxobacter sp. (strain Fw109-5) TaxID=404589 RepID=UPI0000ED807B|nr:acetyl-CoA C-acyltransferase [Anaeromyxobacter sp. Fw109-5]ABS27076.1 acetyl-CoA acetyltransferase [Anaeromyxobacter sp. Fw109-5]